MCIDASVPRALIIIPSKLCMHRKRSLCRWQPFKGTCTIIHLTIIMLNLLCDPCIDWVAGSTNCIPSPWLLAHKCIHTLTLAHLTHGRSLPASTRRWTLNPSASCHAGGYWESWDNSLQSRQGQRRPGSYLLTCKNHPLDTCTRTCKCHKNRNSTQE